MAVVLSAQVPQKSSAKFVVSFKDIEDDSDVIPVSVTWSLYDLQGNVINGRDQVSASPAAEVEVFLSGDDLDLVDENNELEQRRFLVEATYSNGAETLPLRQEGQFAIYNLTGVPQST